MMPKEAAEIINETKKKAAGAWSASARHPAGRWNPFAADDGTCTEKSAWTDIFIYPGYRFKAMDALVTNFHLPESTLVMLVSAFAGREHILNAYRTAVQEKYRFFSFGDAMFIADGLSKQREH